MEPGKILNFFMRTFQFIWSVLVMALVGNILADAYSGKNPAVINYDMFVVAFALVSLFYLWPVTIIESWTIHPVLPFILDLLNAIFSFAAAVAMSAELNVHSCHNHAYLDSNKITRGAKNKTERCQEAQASTAFLWFLWAAFTVSAVITGLGMRGFGTVRSTRGVRRSGPAMSQV